MEKATSNEARPLCVATPTVFRIIQDYDMMGFQKSLVKMVRHQSEMDNKQC
jgi:hypothetical protein